MADEHQAQADPQVESTVATSIPEQANDPNLGATNVADYHAMIARLAQGEEPAVNPTDSEAEQDAPNGEEEVPTEAVEEAAQEEPEEPTDEDGQEAPEQSKRYRFKDPDDVAIAAIAKANGISLLEAAKQFEATKPAKAEVSEEEAPSRTSDGITEELLSLQEELDGAFRNIELDKVADLNKQIFKLMDEREALRVQEREQASTRKNKAQADFDQAYDASLQQACGFYPDLLDPNSALSKEVYSLDQRAMSLGDPLFNSPDKPLTIAKKAALKLGILMADPADPKTAVKKAHVSRPVTPASGNARTTPAAPAPKLDAQLGKVKSVADYERLIGANF
jgi:hypothetical protein